MRAAILAIAVAAVPLVAVAAELPASLHGTWRVANPTGDQCRRDAVNAGAEGHMTVTPGVVTHYESTLPDRVGQADADAAIRSGQASWPNSRCEGEGMRWRARALFHLETVAGQKLVAVTTLSRVIHARRAGAA